MIVYGKQPDLNKNGMPYGTLKKRLSFYLGRSMMGDSFVVGSDEPVVNTSKRIEVIVPPRVTKQTMPFNLGSGKLITNSINVYEYE